MTLCGGQCFDVVIIAADIAHTPIHTTPGEIVDAVFARIMNFLRRLGAPAVSADPGFQARAKTRGAGAA